jgi:branched-chain amino acid transport system ATP-binding protein
LELHEPAEGIVASPAGIPSTIGANTKSDLVAVKGLGGGYGRKQVVFDVDLHVREGEIVSIVGHNGAGKTTVLRTIYGMLPAIGGKIVYRGEDTTKVFATHNAANGMALIPAERFVFGDLTVKDNLLLGALHVKSAAVREERWKRVHTLFPILAERSAQKAGTMSGGQQRMVSLGLALMSGPRLLMLDEPSLGLAPAVVIEIFSAIRKLADEEGLSVLVLEQNIGQALRIADRFYVMRSGRMILEETNAQMRARKDYWDLF